MKQNQEPEIIMTEQEKERKHKIKIHQERIKNERLGLGEKRPKCEFIISYDINTSNSEELKNDDIKEIIIAIILIHRNAKVNRFPAASTIIFECEAYINELNEVIKDILYGYGFLTNSVLCQIVKTEPEINPQDEVKESMVSKVIEYLKN